MTNSDLKPIRTFIALALSDLLQHRLRQCQTRLKESSANLRWIPATSIHLTLAFLGDTLPDRIKTLTGALHAPLNTLAPFTIKVKGTGTFGPPQHPRVVWAGIVPSEPLNHLHSVIRNVLQELAFKTENRPFSPHLTLGRIKSTRNLPVLRELLEKETATVHGCVPVDRVLLYQSRTKPTGAEYTPLQRFTLAG